MFLALAIGAAVGVATLLAFGRPDQHPSMAAVAASLGLTGLSVAELAPVEKEPPRFAHVPGHPRRRRSCPRQGAQPGGTLGRSPVPPLPLPPAEERRRRAPLHLVAPRRRARGPRVAAGTRRRRAHAASAAPSPRWAAIRCCSRSTTSTGSGLDTVAGESTTRCSARCGTRSSILRQHRIAHRDLRRSNIVVDDVRRGLDRRLRLQRGRGRRLAARCRRRAAPRRAHPRGRPGTRGRLRHSAVGRSTRCRSSLRLLQLNALSGATRSALRQRKGLLKELQTTVAQSKRRRPARVHPARTPRPQGDPHHRDARPRRLLPAAAVQRPSGHRRPGQGGELDLVRARDRWRRSSRTRAPRARCSARCRNASVSRRPSWPRSRRRSPARWHRRRSAAWRSTSRVPPEDRCRPGGRSPRGRAQRGGGHRDAHRSAVPCSSCGRASPRSSRSASPTSTCSSTASRSSPSWRSSPF